MAMARLGTVRLPGTERAGADQALVLEHRAVEHDGARTDERAVADRAPLEVHEVADDALVADPRRGGRRGVHDRAVLDRRARADDDPSGIAAQDGGGPHRRLGADGDVADHHRVGVDVGGRVDGGLDVAERVDRHGPQTAKRP